MAGFSAKTSASDASALGKSAAYWLSCCNPAFYCNEGDGIAHYHCCGKECCTCQSSGCCACCATVCLGPCILYAVAHKVRACHDVDYNDFFGGGGPVSEAIERTELTNSLPSETHSGLSHREQGSV